MRLLVLIKVNIEKLTETTGMEHEKNTESKSGKMSRASCWLCH